MSPSRHRSKRLPVLHAATPAKFELNVSIVAAELKVCMKEDGSFSVGVLKSSVAVD